MTHSSPFERWQALAAGLYMSIVGYSVLAGIPVISTAWSSLLSFSEPQVGRVAGADLGGLSFGAVLAALFVAKMNRRVLVVLSVLGAVAANLACTLYQSYEATLLLRFLAGTASGVFTGIAVATLGARLNSARAFNYLLFAFAFVQAAELYYLPRMSMNTIYTAFAFSYLPALFMLSWVPETGIRTVTETTSDKEIDHKVGGSTSSLPVETVAGQKFSEGVGVVSAPSIDVSLIPRSVPWLCLTAMALTYVNIGAYWTYIELASANAALDAEWVSSVLVWVSFFALIGCLVATLISDRFGLGKPLLLTLLIHALIVAILVPGIDESRFFVSVYAFNFLWIFIDVYQMASVARLDPSGRFASLMPAAQGLGQIIGPNIAASLLGASLGYSSVFVLCAIASLLACAVYAVAYAVLAREPQVKSVLGAAA
ncbi:MAG: MFS transporter [Pseudomonadota bacterium]